MLGIEDKTADELKELVHLEADYNSKSLEMMDEADSRYLRDLKVNLKNTMKSDNLDAKEVALIGLSVSVNEKNDHITEFFKQKAIEAEATSDELSDASACASLLASNNVFYRFRHFADKESYEKMPAGIKMNIMMKPSVGKEFFELLSLVVSAVNGCERCVKAHEQSLIKMGTDEKRIFDAIRLASVVVSLTKVIY